jgi:hypothetical protein
MAIGRTGHVGPDILKNTPCELNHACLSGMVCRVEPFIDRDVQLLRCRDERQCAFKRACGRLFVCTCPVNRAAHGLN